MLYTLKVAWKEIFQPSVLPSFQSSTVTLLSSSAMCWFCTPYFRPFAISLDLFRKRKQPGFRNVTPRFQLGQQPLKFLGINRFPSGDFIYEVGGIQIWVDMPSRRKI
jgi:hypothetical protein